MRYFLVFSYDGSKFHGYERQKNVKNIQGTLENAISEVLNEKIVVKASGRTDAGVHALMGTAHFDTTKKITKDFKNELNNMLNGEIIIKKIKVVDNNFHARFSVKNKTYRYLINLNKKNINDFYYFTSFVNLDINKMKEASKLFIGTHDFHNFVSGYRDDYHTHIYKIKIYRKKDFIVLEFTGKGFYRYMVRHLVGALYDVGRGKAEKEVIQKMIDYPNLEKQLTVMRPNGLYLVKVKY